MMALVAARREGPLNWGIAPELLGAVALITVGIMKNQIAKLMVAVGFAGAVVAGTITSCDDNDNNASTGTAGTGGSSLAGHGGTTGFGGTSTGARTPPAEPAART